MQGEARRFTSIEELAALGHPRDRHGRMFAMIEAYIDESGIHDQARALVVAGYWGSRNGWKTLQVRWLAALRKHRVLLHEFHAKHFFPRTGRFAPTADCDWDAMENDLLSAVEAANVHPCSFILQVDEFWKRTERERRFLTGANLSDPNLQNAGRPSKPYWAAFFGVLNLICGEHTPAGSKTHFFYGIDRPARAYAEEVFAAIKNEQSPTGRPTWHERLGTPSAPKASESPHLQAADALAYVTWAGAEAAIRQGAPKMLVEAEPFGRARRRLLKNNRGAGEFRLLNKEGLDALLSPLNDGAVAAQRD